MWKFNCLEKWKGSFKDGGIDFPETCEGKYLSRIWESNTKYINWKIWLSRNNKIFEGKQAIPGRVALSAKLQLKEYNEVHKRYICSTSNFTESEMQWATNFMGSNSL